MYFSDRELPNPILITVNRTFVAYQNETPGGIHFTKVLRYPDTGGASYAQERAIIRLNFADIPPSDVANFEEAFRQATEGYVVLSLPGLGVSMPLDAGYTMPDTAYVTVAPGAAFAHEISQGYTLSVATGQMDGPYLETFTLALMTGDLRYANGS